MSRYQISEWQEIATLRAQLALRDVHRHDVGQMLAAIPPGPAALLGSAVDDVLVATLTACPGCGADVQEPCRWDCSSNWREGR